LGGRGDGPPATDPKWDTQLFGTTGKYAFGEFSFDATATEVRQAPVAGESRDMGRLLPLASANCARNRCRSSSVQKNTLRPFPRLVTW
jgi:hypothetical protein